MSLDNNPRPRSVTGAQDHRARRLAAYGAVAGLVIAGYLVFDAGTAMVLLFICAVFGYLSTLDGGNHGQTDVAVSGTGSSATFTLRDGCALVLALGVGALAWVVAFVAGILLDVTPFLYAVGDEVYPYADLHAFVCLVVAVVATVLAWRLLQAAGARPRQ
ncbi:hypothetical protein [Nocardioides sp.]|uniref:hypothetical protein n=1 Tax=Nocardioides sp. TaxID=35761 RepID=UPI002BEADD21|nr:hypothetical protein [Nocardioides sp.]HXH78582.1 hypothetical protein [Nocardioides sp.]